MANASPELDQPQPLPQPSRANAGGVERLVIYLKTVRLLATTNVRNVATWDILKFAVIQRRSEKNPEDEVTVADHLERREFTL